MIIAAHEKEVDMSPEDLTTLPEPAFAGGTRAMTTTPVVGSPAREYADMFVPGQEQLDDGGAARDDPR